MPSIDRFKNLLSMCKFHDWEFIVKLDDNRPYLQVCATTEDNTSPGDKMSWKSRKWFLSKHMTDSEVVQTAFKAVLTAVEHETRECFLYNGRHVFGPHFDINDLWELAGQAPDARRLKALNWIPVGLDDYKCSTPFGEYRCVRNHLDVSSLWFDKNHIFSDGSGSHEKSKDYAWDHYNKMFDESVASKNGESVS